MRRSSKQLITLALVSSVASFVLVPADAGARSGYRPKQPSVEIHLEVLNSLRVTGDTYYNSGANRGYRNAPPRPSRVTVPPAPAYTGESFASQVVREVPVASVPATPSYNVASRRPMRSETIVQPLPGVNSGSAAVRSIGGSTSGEVIMQKLPTRSAPKVEPSEEEVIMQPLPQTEMAFPLADGVSPAGQIAGLATADEPQTPEEKGSFLDTLTSFFSSEDEPAPKLKTSPSAPIQALPVIAEPVLPDNTMVGSVVEGAEATGDSFFSMVDGELADAPMIEPEPEEIITPDQPAAVNPPDEMVARMIYPELQASAPFTGDEAVPAPESTGIEPVVPHTVVSEAPKEVMLSEPPKDYVVVEKTRPAPVSRPVLAAPAKPRVVAPPVAVQERALTAAAEPEETASLSQERFPRLSEVEAVAPEPIEELPQSAQDWLAEDSDTSPVAAPEPAPLPTVDTATGSILDELLEEQAAQELQPEPEPEKSAPVVQALPDPSPLPAPLTEPKVVEPQRVAKLEEPVIDLPEPEIEAPAVPMSHAEESLLNNALDSAHDEEPVLEKAEGEEPTFMEMALDELEPAEPEFKPEPLQSEDFALLEPVAEPKPQPKVVKVPAAPVAKKEEEGLFPGITKTFKGLLGGDEKKAAPAPAPVAKAPSMPVVEKQVTAKNVMPPELPVANTPQSSLPSMDLLDQDVGNRFLDDALGMPEFDEVAMPPSQPVDTMAPVAETEEFDVASLPAAPKVTPPNDSIPASVVLRIPYGADDTDIPDGQKPDLTDLAAQAKEKGSRIIVSSYASGEEDESKAANMISLSRGLSLRAFFIDAGVAMDRIIVQAKGLENAGGPPDRADISLD